MAEAPESQDPQMADLVREALQEVMFPGYERDIVSMGAVGNIRACGGAVIVELHARTPDEEKKQTLF